MIKTSIVTPCTLPDGTIAWTIFMERDSMKPSLHLCVYDPKPEEFFIRKTPWLTTVASSPLSQDFDFAKTKRLDVACVYIAALLTL